MPNKRERYYFPETIHGFGLELTGDDKKAREIIELLNNVEEIGLTPVKETKVI